MSQPPGLVRAFQVERCEQCNGSGVLTTQVGIHQCRKCLGIGQTYTEASDHRIIDADQIAALGRVLKWVNENAWNNEPIRSDLAILAAVVEFPLG